MRYLDFNTPKCVLRSIFYDCLISVRGACLCVWVHECVGRGGSGDSDCVVECC